MTPKHRARGALVRRYRYLWTGEAGAVLVFLFIFITGTPPAGHWSGWIARTYAFGLVVLILIQAVLWWRVRLRSLRVGTREVPPRVRSVYRALKWLNWVLIGAFLPALVAKAAAIGTGWMDADFALGLLWITLALLEQVNYFHYQLMYDNRHDLSYLFRHGRLKRGSIQRVLDRATP